MALLLAPFYVAGQLLSVQLFCVAFCVSCVVIISFLELSEIVFFVALFSVYSVFAFAVACYRPAPALYA